jgi:hypothetical protein
VGFLDAADDVGRADDNPRLLGVEQFAQGADGVDAHFQDSALLPVAAHMLEFGRERDSEVFEVRASD